MLTKAVRNGLWNALSTLTSALTGIVVSVIVIRTLDTQAYGEVSYYAWLAGLLSALGVLAFPAALTRFISELRGQGRPQEGEALAGWVTRGLLALNALVGLVLLVWAARSPYPVSLYLAITAPLPFMNALGRLLTSSFWGNEEYRPAAISLVLASFLQLGIAAAAAFFHWGEPGFLLALLSLSAVGSVSLLFYAIRKGVQRHLFQVRQGPSRATLLMYLAFSLPMILQTIFEMIIWQRSEVYFLAQLSTQAQIGYYSLAFTIYGLCVGMGYALVGGFFPAIARDFGAGDWVRVREKIAQGVVLTTLFATPLSFGALTMLGTLIYWLYGEKMFPSVPVAQILFLGLIPSVMVTVTGLTMGAIRRPWATIPLGVAASVLNIGLDFLLIPKYGAIGAAFANTGAQVFYTLGAYWVLLRVIGVTGRLYVPWVSLGTILLLGFVTTYLVPHWLVLQGLDWLAIPLAGVLYLGAVWRLGYLRALQEREGYRVLHILGSRILPQNPDAEGVSGVVRAALEIARAQTQQGYQVWVAAVGTENWEREWQGVRLISLRPASIPVLHLVGRELDLRVHLPFVRLCLLEAFDIVHTHLYDYVRGLRARARVIHFHSDPLTQVYQGQTPALGPGDFRLVARQSQAQVGVSQFVARRLQQGFSQHGLEGQVYWVHNGVDTQRFDPQRYLPLRRKLRQSWGVAEDETVFLFVGAIVLEKGVIHLARAFARLSQRYPKVHLVVAGSSKLWGSQLSSHDPHQAYAEEVRQTVGRCKAHFLGNLPADQIPAVYAAADVVVTPSVMEEAFGLVALEGMASGKPVIASISGGLPEVVQLEAGLLVPPGDETALEAALHTLAEDPLARRSRGLAARQIALGFTWANTAQGLEQVYRAALQRHYAPARLVEEVPHGEEAQTHA
jgi:glycosyltransferase involved in cell wall biosynthesis/O-antigen/teichoic acid export membrane protein